MQSLILSSIVRFLMPLLLVFSAFLLFRGHNDPGGGFIGGLVAAIALALHGLAYGPAAVRYVVRVNPRTIFGIGLMIAIGASLVAVFQNKAFFQGVWFSVPTPLGYMKVGTPVIFDLGVYFVVIGIVLTIILALSEE